MHSKKLDIKILITIPLLIAMVGGSGTPMRSLAASYSPQGQGTSYTFPETGKTVSGRFLQYWNEHGAVTQQGYPISDPMSEVSIVDGKIYTVQYFERAVFEAHPENQAPNDVLLSLVGVFTYSQRYASGSPGQLPNTQLGSRLFTETNKHIGGPFLDYWNSHGGLAQQGLPISEEFIEISPTNGQSYLVQYFERAEFEYHPEIVTSEKVLLSQLGSVQYARNYAGGGPIRNTPPTSAVPAAPPAPPAPLPPTPTYTAVPAPPPPPPPTNTPARSVPKDAVGYARYLANNFARIGNFTMHFERTGGLDAEGIHVVSLDLDLDTELQFKKQVSKADARAWANAVNANAVANWPTEDYIIELSWATYSDDPCFRDCSDECYYQSDDYTSGRGWYTTFTYVYLSSISGTTICEYYFDH